ncbi:MAG: PilZ domain-containing protein [Desulfobacteraceae bacterium]|nr:PilZ domain-containing protein [Desulfobacteraceae bacterium]
MKKQSIELKQVSEDTDIPKIVRKSFRIPVEERDKISVTIRGKSYPLSDISMSGVRIYPAEKTDFTVDKKIESCKLHIYDTTITGLTGEIVHFSLNSGEQWQYGIKWIDLDKGQKDQLSQNILSMKEKLLQDSNDNFDNNKD